MLAYLFVYGTLLRGSPHAMARQLQERARFAGEARLAARLYDLGRFPGIQPPRTAEDWVHGELFDLGPEAAATLRDMDAYELDESTPEAMFEREEAVVLRPDGAAARAWVYWFRGAVDEARHMPSGRYYGAP